VRDRGELGVPTDGRRLQSNAASQSPQIQDHMNRPSSRSPSCSSARPIRVDRGLTGYGHCLRKHICDRYRHDCICAIAESGSTATRLNHHPEAYPLYAVPVPRACGTDVSLSKSSQLGAPQNNGRTPMRDRFSRSALILMVTTAQVIAAGNGLAQGDRAPPDCAAEPGRRAERISGEVVKVSTLSKLTPGGWILRLVPNAEGWFLRVAAKGRETEDLSRLTPPWHFVPNAREIEGWHFCNVANTGPNDGSVNAPQELREFTFRQTLADGSSTTAAQRLPRTLPRFDHSDEGGCSSRGTYSHHRVRANALALNR